MRQEKVNTRNEDMKEKQHMMAAYECEDDSHQRIT